MPGRVTYLVLALAMLAAACAGGDGGAGGRVGASPDAATGDQPTRADRVTIAVPSDEGPLNLFAQHEEPLTELVYDKLLAPSPYDEPRPWLAESVEQIDAVTWDVAVRDDVTWHDGEPFTADDVAFTIALFKRAPSGRWTHHVTDTPHVEQVEVIDDTHVRFHCAYPCPFLGSVTLADIPIVPEHVWEGVEDPKAMTDLPVGTGPYRLASYDPESGYVFEAYENHFAGAPLVDELVLPIIPDPSTAFTALRTGEVDAVARLVSPELVERFRSDPAITVVDTSPLLFPEVRINFERSPFDRHGFRTALSAAVDRQELLDTVWLGQGRPATQGYMHPDTPWAAPGIEVTYEPERATQLLDELGLTDSDGDGVREVGGAPIAFSIQVPGNEPTWIRAAELLAEQWAAVGLQATVQQVDPGTIGGLFRSREFDTYITGAPTHGVADPTQFVMSHESGYLWDLPEVAYPEMATVIEEWRATERIEERTEKLFEMERLFNSQPTSIPLYYPDGPMAFRADAYDGWAESPGYGLFHKWSLLPRDVARQVNAITERADLAEGS